MRQVIHALLTRPPLSHRTIIPEGNQVKCFVRLACVKHAASVHPEPGSNSHKKFFPFQNQLANFNHSLIPNVTVLGCFDFRLCCSLELILMRISSLFSMNLSRLFHCSVIKVLCILLLFSNFYRLSHLITYVKKFFSFFSESKTESDVIFFRRSFSDVDYLTIAVYSMSTAFLCFFDNYFCHPYIVFFFIKATIYGWHFSFYNRYVIFMVPEI